MSDKPGKLTGFECFPCIQNKHGIVRASGEYECVCPCHKSRFPQVIGKIYNYVRTRKKHTRGRPYSV